MALPVRLATLVGALMLMLALAAASGSRAAQRSATAEPRAAQADEEAAVAAFGAVVPAAAANVPALAETPADAAEPDPLGEAASGTSAASTPASLAASAAEGAATTPAGQAPGAVRGELRAPLIARVRRGTTVLVRRRPNGPVRAKLGAKTEFGSRRTIAVAAVRGDWLGVATTARADGGLSWVHRRSGGIRLAAARVTVEADLSSRTVEVRTGESVLKRATVAIGRPGSSTPTGVFAVTDKLDGRKMSPYYGCCILALSGTQPNLPAGWKGGNRLAIHGTSSPGTIGKAASAGCLRGSDRDLQALMRLVPLGTTVTIRA